MIEPKEVLVKGKKFIISKFPAYDGREILTCYIASGVPKIGDYKRNEEISQKMMGFVGVPIEGAPQPLMLITKDLVNNHVSGAEMLIDLEFTIMEYNFSFFQRGQVLSLFQDLAQKVRQWISKTWTDLLEVSSRTVKQP